MDNCLILEMTEAEPKRSRRSLRPESSVRPDAANGSQPETVLTLKRRIEDLQARIDQLERERLAAGSEPGEDDEAGPVGTVDFDNRGSVRRVNGVAAGVLGAHPDRITGRPFAQFVSTRDIRKFLSHLRACFESGESRSIELRLRGNEEATTVQLWSLVRPDPLLGEPVCRTTLADMSDRHRAEEALRESKECFRIMADTAPVLVWMSSEDGLCTYFNRAWIEFTGRTLKQELGNGWVDSVHPDDAARILDAYHLSFGARERFSFEFRLRRADKQYRWFLNTGVPRFTPQRSFAGYIGSCIDITERKEAEEMRRQILEDLEILVQQRTAHLKAANRKLRQEVTARKRLEKQIVEIADCEKHRIGTDLHDGLGQQLTGLAFLSKVLEQKLGAKSIPETKEAGQIHQLINQALSHARELARGLHVVELDAGGLRSALQELRHQIENMFSIPCALKYQRSLAIHNPTVATHLFRIAQEAVNNAVKHGQAGRIEISLARVDRRIVLTVRDDGVGCPVGNQGKNGIGLRTMKYRSEMIRGAFEIQRPPEGGTRIICSFPVSANKKPTHQSYV